MEGLAAGPAIEGRWGKKAIELADREEVWEMEANYIAQALVDYTSVCRIIFPEQMRTIKPGLPHSGLYKNSIPA